MRRTPQSSSWLRAAAVLVGAWTLVGLVAIAGGVAAHSSGRPLPSHFFFVNNGVGMWLWALCTPAIFALCERRPVEGPRWGRTRCSRRPPDPGVGL